MDDPLEHGGPSLAEEYILSLHGKGPATPHVYRCVLLPFTAWIAERPGSGGTLPEQLTRTARATCLAELEAAGYRMSHRARVKAVVSGFARWLIEEQRVLRRNPAPDIVVPPQPLLAPRELSPDQRLILRQLAERDERPRSAALFTLGYWSGCRVTDVAWLQLAPPTSVRGSAGCMSATKAAKSATSICTTRPGGHSTTRSTMAGATRQVRVSSPHSATPASPRPGSITGFARSVRDIVSSA